MAETDELPVQDLDRLVADNKALAENLAQKGRGYALSIGVVIDQDEIVSIVHDGLRGAAESWVSQVHRSALRRLRCLYQAEAEAS